MNNKKIFNNLNQVITKFLNSESKGATATKFLLAIVAIGGIMAVGAAMPGLLKFSRKFKRSRKYTDARIKNAFYNLKRRKLVEIIEEKNEKIKVKLTNKGKERIREFSLENLKIEKPKKWDKKWRVLIFDFPSKKYFKNAREAFREKIKELGFYQLQKSVWVIPHPCEDELLILAEYFNVGKYVGIITAEKILHEENLRKNFKIT